MTELRETRQCPYCKEEIKSDAVKCKHCGSGVSPEKPAHQGVCPFCKEQIHPEALKCKHCRSALRSEKDCDCQGEHVAGDTTFATLRAGSGVLEGIEVAGPMVDERAEFVNVDEMPYAAGEVTAQKWPRLKCRDLGCRRRLKCVQTWGGKIVCGYVRECGRRCTNGFLSYETWRDE